MEESAFLGFVSALGEEFARVVFDVCGKLPPPQDGYEVFRLAFQEDPSPQRLAALTKGQLETLRAACQKHLGTREKITLDHMRTWVASTLRRWPATG